MSMPHTCRCGICGHLMSAPGLMGFGSFGPSLLAQPRAMVIGDLLDFSDRLKSINVHLLDLPPLSWRYPPQSDAGAESAK